MRVAGETCKVTHQTHTEIRCITKGAASVTTSAPQLGQNGVKWAYYPGATLTNVMSKTPVNETLHTATDGYNDFSENYVQRFHGWFIAPETARYRFRQTCDDHC